MGEWGARSEERGVNMALKAFYSQIPASQEISWISGSRCKAQIDMGFQVWIERRSSIVGHPGRLQGNPAPCLQTYQPERCGKFFENRIGALWRLKKKAEPLLDPAI
jgi:hypothetical protein